MHKALSWQTNCIDNILSLYRSQKLHHGLLISGAKGSGKITLLNYLGDYILNNSKNYNPDLFLCNDHLGQENKNIPVDTVRDIINFVSKTAFLGKNKVVIIPNIEYFNTAAANAFLKILEEPPKNVYFLLSCDNLKNILPTLRSRCYKIKSPMADYKQAIDWLIENNVEQNKAIELLKITNNMPILALDYYNDKVYDNLYVNLVSGLLKLNRYNLTLVSSDIDKIKYSFRLLLEFWHKILHQVLMYKLNRSQDVNNELSDIKKLNDKLNIDKLNLAIDKITLSYKYMHKNMHLNKRSSIEGILYELC